MYLELIRSNPTQPSPLPDPVIPPDLSEGSHLSYSVQWLIFALCAAVGWVLAVRKSIQTRARGVSASDSAVATRYRSR